MAVETIFSQASGSLFLFQLPHGSLAFGVEARPIHLNDSNGGLSTLTALTAEPPTAFPPRLRSEGSAAEAAAVGHFHPPELSVTGRSLMVSEDEDEAVATSGWC